MALAGERGIGGVTLPRAENYGITWRASLRRWGAPLTGPSESHALPPAEVVRALETDADRGLTEAEARERRRRFGPNALEVRRAPPYAAIAARQVADPLVALLIAAAVVSLAVGENVEAIAIGAIVVLNAGLGFGQELGAERAILALRGTLRLSASVVRDGRERLVAAEDVVPGDVIVLRDGERVPADARIVTAEGLAVDESLLTGESVPDDKSPRPVAADAPLADRTSLVFAGTGVTRGRATAVVTATGSEAEVGQVSALAAGAKSPPTPLQVKLAGLTRLMVMLGIAITVALACVRLAQGASLEDAFLLGVSVAVAAVPEGLAATVTIALALGARRMADRGAIVRRLPAVETLGSASVVASDKTGTLTENDLRLRDVAPTAGSNAEAVLAAAVLASTARAIGEKEGEVRIAGDPVERALMLAAIERGVTGAELRVVRELPFDPERRRMTVVYDDGSALQAYTKGAPEAVLARCRADAAGASELAVQAEEWASAGLRVLAVATRTLDAVVGADEEAVEHDLVPLGLVALHDPLRPGAADAVSEARAAGLQVQILTGDHPATAGSIARELELPATAVSARVTPRDKLRVVEELQASGEVVAVTGDGVNDAPALRQADVGIAMGRSGTEAAREAADVVLTDHDFSTLLAAIREGRAITDNVRKFVSFLLSANFGEVVLFVGAVVSGLGAPMTVVQVLMVNVLTDGLPAVALAADPAEPDVMRRAPERSDRLFGARSWPLLLLLVGLAVGGASLAAFLVGRELDDDAAQTMAFATVAIAELMVVFALRSATRPSWREKRNSLLLAAVGVSASLLLVTIYAQPLHEAFGTVSLDPVELGVVVAFAAVPFVVAELAKRARASA